MNVEVVGDELKVSQFERLKDGITKPRQLYMDIGTVVRNDAKRIAPKRSGKMARAIHMRATQKRVRVISPKYYSRWVSYGSVHNPNPIPFLDIALAKNAYKIQTLAEDAVQRAITESGL